ncbi:MAG: hypothetical protein K2Q01_05340, partial [Rickettsiales bacterium]|nr:hypothetical protein [Rickettsiales bacterium]
KEEAKQQGEALVEAFILSRMPGLLPGAENAPPPPYDEKREEQYLIAGELLMRSNTRNITGIPLKGYQNPAQADGSEGTYTMESRPMHRRQFNTRAALGTIGLGLGVAAIGDTVAKEYKSWVFSRTAPEQNQRVVELHRKLAKGQAITHEDLTRVDMKAMSKEAWAQSDPDTDRALLASITKITLAGSAAVVGAVKLYWHVAHYRGNAPDRAVHEHAKVMLDVSRNLDKQTRAVYDAIPTPPSALPPESAVAPGA